MSAPKLRFKEFDTEVEVKRLGDISNIVVGFVGTVSDQYCDKSEGIPFVRTQNVRDGYFSLDNLEYVTQDFHQKNKKSQIFNGDVLIARVGANMGMVCAVENLNTEANCANVIIIKKNSQLSSEYLSLFLNSENGQKQIHSGGAGGAQAVFNTTLAKEIRFPYFPLDEQTKIASFLSAVDEKIAQLTQKHELLSQYKQGMMQKLFSQQIRFKADDGSEFEEWSNKTIGDIANIKRGASPRPITDSKWFDPRQYRGQQIPLNS
ncbi:restriction endonuclease subunit S [Acinetobacter baumannii]|uniref:restriction endonuclease subunit S n=1 Tax=Acinetobacter baumannii TaxID=470 RepID=UPI0010A39953|nr:restriction endonuclease subunit S [Acinetobacter baumannii]THD93172.1 restriction endonuclease subunit S [Acinetobacter baumannii]